MRAQRVEFSPAIDETCAVTAVAAKAPPDDTQRRSPRVCNGNAEAYGNAGRIDAHHGVRDDPCFRTYGSRRQRAAALRTFAVFVQPQVSIGATPAGDISVPVRHRHAPTTNT